MSNDTPARKPTIPISAFETLSWLKARDGNPIPVDPQFVDDVEDLVVDLPAPYVTQDSHTIKVEKSDRGDVLEVTIEKTIYIREQEILYSHAHGIIRIREPKPQPPAAGIPTYESMDPPRDGN